MQIKKCNLLDARTVALLDSKYIECPWNEEMIKDAMNNSLYVFFKAEEDGQILGYGSAHVVFDEAEVCNIAVFEEHRNKGVGKSILNSILDHCKARGVKKVFLEVNELNVGAIALYDKVGFKSLSKRENYYKSGNAIVMSLEI